MKTLKKSISAYSEENPTFLWKKEPTWKNVITPIVEEKFQTPHSQLQILKEMVSGLNEDYEGREKPYNTTREKLMTNIVRQADSFVYSIERAMEGNEKIDLLSQTSKSKINEIIDNFVILGKKEIVTLQEKGDLTQNAKQVIPILKGVFEQMANMQPFENLQSDDVSKFLKLAQLFTELIESEESFVQNFMPGFVAGRKRSMDEKEIKVNPENGYVLSQENFDDITPENRQLYGLW